MVGIVRKGGEASGVEESVPSIRFGMKREYAAMMKAQVGYEVSVGLRRVTRSQNGGLGSGTVSKSPGGGRKVEAKKRRKVVKGGEDVDLETEDGGKVGVVVMSEDEEPKSDVLDGSVEDDAKGEVVEVTKGEDIGAKVGRECNEVDADCNVGRVNVDMKSNVDRTDVEVDSIDAKPLGVENCSIEKNVQKMGDGVEYELENVSDLVKETVVESVEAVDNCATPKAEPDIAVGVENELENVSDLVKETVAESVEAVDNCATPKAEPNMAVLDSMLKDLSEMIDSPKKILKVYVKSGKRGKAVAVSAEGSGQVSVPDKPLRRFTRSSLTPNPLPSRTLGGEDVKDTPAETDMKLSKKVAWKRLQFKLKDLLETGLLEGLHVRYMRGSKVKPESETGLEGVITGLGILCYCEKCNASEVVNPNQFELHAGSSNKRPLEYIHLESGKSLSDLLNICKNVPLGSLEQAIQSAIGSSNEKSSTFCLNCKGHISLTGTGQITILCDSCVVIKESQGNPTQITDNRERSSICLSGTNSCDQMDSSILRSKSKGRLTRKDNRLHKLVFEDDVLPDGTALAYYSRGKKMLEGYKKGFGIFCYCCENEVSPSVFEAHAGYGSRRKPYLSIYISNGVSLHELSVRLAKERKVSAEENDDLCTICADGGDLICCDSCPRAFHADCVSLPNLPQGAWHCSYCENTFQKEKFVEHNANAIAAGRVLGSDPLEQLMTRCIRIVENLDADCSACVLCRGKDFSKTGFGPQTVIICDQCEKEYHIGCLKKHNMDDLKELPEGKWFCCVECNKVHTALEKLVADGEIQVPENLVAMIKEKHANLGSDEIPDLDVRWRLLRGKFANEETRKLLSDAVTIFHERFDPIADSKSSRLDLIPQMVYGSNFKDQDLGGMYTAVLTVNSIVVCGGIFRVFGQAVAELPLVATSTERQGQGYFQCLFSCMENLFASLDVKDLVLPAAEEAESLWINKFGFEKITQEEVKDYRQDHQMMIFQGTSMLHKSVQKSSMSSSDSKVPN